MGKLHILLLCKAQDIEHLNQLKRKQNQNIPYDHPCMATLFKSMKSTLDAKCCNPSTWSSISDTPCGIKQLLAFEINKQDKLQVLRFRA